MRYCPVPSVTAVRIFSISAGLAASTVTPGSTAPDASLTTPLIVGLRGRHDRQQHREPEHRSNPADSEHGDLRWLMTRPPV